MPQHRASPAHKKVRLRVTPSGRQGPPSARPTCFRVDGHDGDAGEEQRGVPPLAQRRAARERELHAHRPAGGNVPLAAGPQVVQGKARVEYAPQELDVEQVPYGRKCTGQQ